MGKIFCVEFQRSPLKFHTKYLTHSLKDVHFILLGLRAHKPFFKRPPGYEDAAVLLPGFAIKL